MFEEDGKKLPEPASMLLPDTSLLPPADVFTNKPSETDPLFPHNPQSPLAPAVIIPKTIFVCLVQLVAPKEDAPTLVQLVLPNRKPVAGFEMLGDPNGCGVDCLSTNQRNQLVDVITVAMTKLNIKTNIIDFS